MEYYSYREGLRWIDRLTIWDLRRCNQVCKTWNGCFQKKYNEEIITWLYYYLLVSCHSTGITEIMASFQKKIIKKYPKTLVNIYLYHENGQMKLSTKLPFWPINDQPVWILDYGDRKLGKYLTDLHQVINEDHLQELINTRNSFTSKITELTNNTNLIRSKEPVSELFNPLMWLEYTSIFPLTNKFYQNRQLLFGCYLKRWRIT